MSEATLEFIELDWRANAVGAAVQRIRLTLARGSLLLFAWVFVYWALHWVRRMHGALAEAEVHTDEDRAQMAECAEYISRYAALLDHGLSELADGERRLSWLDRWMVRRLEQLCSEMEDAAETAALAASPAFAAFIESELGECLGTVAGQGD